MSDATRKAEIGPNSSTILSEQRVMQRITEANGAVYGKYFSALGLCDMIYIICLSLHMFYRLFSGVAQYIVYGYTFS